MLLNFSQSTSCERNALKHFLVYFSSKSFACGKYFIKIDYYFTDSFKFVVNVAEFLSEFTSCHRNA